MIKEIDYNQEGHGSLAEEWLPHYDTQELWQARGFLHNAYDIKQLYAYLFSLSRTIDEYYELQMRFYDFSSQEHLAFRRVIPQQKAMQGKMEIDEDCILFGSDAHILNEKRAMALKMQQDDFSLDLCLLKKKGVLWLGSGERLTVMDEDGDAHPLYCATCPNMGTYGLLNWRGQEIKIKGRSSFDRIWGYLSLYHSPNHWQRLRLFFFDGEEVVLIHFPGEELS